MQLPAARGSELRPSCSRSPAAKAPLRRVAAMAAARVESLVDTEAARSPSAAPFVRAPTVLSENRAVPFVGMTGVLTTQLIAQATSKSMEEVGDSGVAAAIGPRGGPMGCGADK
jgi:hypothetical protein